MRPPFRRHQSVITAALICLSVLCGCGGDSGPSQLNVSDLNGAWTFNLSFVSTCSFAVSGAVVATLDFNGSEEVANTVSTWSNDPQDPHRYSLIGNIQLGTGEAELRFWQSVLVRGFIVEGTFSAGGTFTGTARDPIPGYDGYLSSGGCDYNVTGQRT